MVAPYPLQVAFKTLQDSRRQKNWRSVDICTLNQIHWYFYLLTPINSYLILCDLPTLTTWHKLLICYRTATLYFDAPCSRSARPKFYFLDSISPYQITTWQPHNYIQSKPKKREYKYKSYFSAFLWTIIQDLLWT